MRILQSHLRHYDRQRRRCYGMKSSSASLAIHWLALLEQRCQGRHEQVCSQKHNWSGRQLKAVLGSPQGATGS